MVSSIQNVYDFDAISIGGEKIPLRRYEGQVLLIVNTASKCGFTPQYEGLEKLQQTFGPRGFNVLGFPCNQFAGQEPGDNAAIAQFCTTSFGVSFPMFQKVDVNGRQAHPLFAYLQKAKPGLLGSSIKWNFTKFLIDRQGAVASRYMPIETPAGLARDIEVLL